MDYFKDKKRKLNGLKKQILFMPNNMVKANKIEGYVQLLSYLKEIEAINSFDADKYIIDNEFTSKYGQYVYKTTIKKIQEIANLGSYLYFKYDRLIDEYKNNDFCSYLYCFNNKVNEEEMHKCIEEFLNILGSDVCLLYNNMIKNDNVSLMPISNFLGISMNSISIDEPCMIIDNIRQYFDFYVTVVHELGHCYQFYLQRNHNHLETFNPFMETTSLLFEKMFCEFLKKKKKFNKILFDNEIADNIYFLNDLSISKLLSGLLVQGDIGEFDPYDLSYKSNFTSKELISEVESDCGYVMKNKRNIDMTVFHYSLGYIIASYFINKMKSNFEETWKEYKDFICMVDNYPLKEILDKYFDLDLMKDNIKTFIKSYHSW